MTDARQQLIDIVNNSVPPWYGEFARYQVQRILEDGAADAILAAGWRPPGPVYVALKHGWTCSDVVGVYSTAEAAEAAHPLDDVEAHAVEC